MDTFTPATDPLAGSIALSALVSLLPLVTFFVMLAVVKAKAHISGLTSLFVAILVAILVFKMPAGMALMSGVMGAVFGAFPVVWIVIMAIWLYQVTVVSGRFEDLRRVFDVIGGGDVRIQSILIAFCFGGLLEALAGFGAPVAITATMLLALGMSPLRAAAAPGAAQRAAAGGAVLSSGTGTAASLATTGAAGACCAATAFLCALRPWSAATSCGRSWGARPPSTALTYLWPSVPPNSLASSMHSLSTTRHGTSGQCWNSNTPIHMAACSMGEISASVRSSSGVISASMNSAVSMQPCSTVL